VGHVAAVRPADRARTARPSRICDSRRKRNRHHRATRGTLADEASLRGNGAISRRGDEHRATDSALPVAPPGKSSAGDAAGQIGDRPLELVAASGRGRLLSLGVEGPYPDVAVTSAADAALFGDDQVTLSTRVLIPPVSLPDAAHASLGATSDGARPPGHPSNILLELQVRQLNGGRLECTRRCKTRFIVSSMFRLQLRIERTWARNRESRPTREEVAEAFRFPDEDPPASPRDRGWSRSGPRASRGLLDSRELRYATVVGSSAGSHCASTPLRISSPLLAASSASIAPVQPVSDCTTYPSSVTAVTQPTRRGGPSVSSTPTVRAASRASAKASPRSGFSHLASILMTGSIRLPS